MQYTEIYQEYITEQIVPHMKAMDELTDAQPTDVPHNGFRTLLWAGELVRSKVLDLEVAPAPRIEIVQSLTPTELLVLMYSMVIFQGCYDLQFDEERADYINAAGSGFHYLKSFRIAFMMGGPQAALNMRNGVRGHFEKIPNLMMKPENVFKYITLLSAAK